MPEKSGQTIAPDHFNTEELARSNWKELVVRFLDREEVVLRYLTSKIVFTDEPVTLEESVALFYAFESIVAKMSKHPDCQRKYGPEVFTFRAIFQSLEEVVRRDPAERARILGERYAFYRGKLFSRRYYYAVKGQIRRLFVTKIRTRFPKKFPPKAYVGKGYGDHGTARDSAFDGNPSWQEVAANLQHDGPRELSTYSTSEKIDWQFETLRCHSEQIFCKTWKL